MVNYSVENHVAVIRWDMTGYPMNVLNEASGATVAAMNIFVLSDGRWRLVSHVGGQVSH